MALTPRRNEFTDALDLMRKWGMPAAQSSELLDVLKALTKKLREWRNAIPAHRAAERLDARWCVAMHRDLGKLAARLTSAPWWLTEDRDDLMPALQAFVERCADAVRKTSIVTQHGRQFRRRPRAPNVDGVVARELAQRVSHVIARAGLPVKASRIEQLAEVLWMEVHPDDAGDAIDWHRISRDAAKWHQHYCRNIADVRARLRNLRRRQGQLSN